MRPIRPRQSASGCTGSSSTSTRTAQGIGPYPAPCRVAVNDSGVCGWSGPRPPIGRHRYFFRLYALDTTLTLPASFTRADVQKAMDGHVLESTVTMGTYLLSTNR